MTKVESAEVVQDNKQKDKMYAPEITDPIIADNQIEMPTLPTMNANVEAEPVFVPKAFCEMSVGDQRKARMLRFGSGAVPTEAQAVKHDTISASLAVQEERAKREARAAKFGVETKEMEAAKRKEREAKFAGEAVED